jgi:hypothetical protein
VQVIELEKCCLAHHVSPISDLLTGVLNFFDFKPHEDSTSLWYHFWPLQNIKMFSNLVTFLE